MVSLSINGGRGKITVLGRGKGIQTLVENCDHVLQQGPGPPLAGKESGGRVGSTPASLAGNRSNHLSVHSPSLCQSGCHTSPLFSLTLQKFR